MSKVHSIIICLMLTLTQVAKAQTNEDTDKLVNDTKNDLMVVIAGGLAGAVLGLSTLSFVEEPKKHTRNIIVGASLGIIAGVGYVAFTQANKSKDLMYGPVEDAYFKKNSNKVFDTYARTNWHWEESDSKSSSIMAPIQLGYSFQY